MFHPIRFSGSLIAALCLSSAAYAEPPTAPNDLEILAEKIEDKLSDHRGDLARSTARLKRTLDSKKPTDNIGDDLDLMADVLEEAFSKDGVFRDLAAMFNDFARDIDVESEDGKSVLSFDGAEIAQIQHNKNRDSKDSFSISGLGKSLTLDRQTIIEDGKSKTRIVIDMDGEDEIDLTLPSLDEK